MTTSSPASGCLPATTRLGRVRLQVADVEHSLAFYTNVLGLRASPRQAGVAMGATMILLAGITYLVSTLLQRWLQRRRDHTPAAARGVP